ncbi:MAG TPA: transketolase C-terminal domain-containing protein, partial [Nitrososphaerales archaeon]|nr:transketolase C-terminal domain-containing protein [Nitrososphaerales archaeon]
KGIVKAIASIPGPFYVRLTRSATPVVYDGGFEYKFGEANVLRDGSDVVVFACGIMVPEALKAAESLKAGGISASVVDTHTVKPIDSGTILRFAQKCGRVVTAEEHNILGGMGSSVAEVLGEGHPAPMKRVGVMDTFGESGDPGELLKKYGLTAASIEQAASGLVHSK